MLLCIDGLLAIGVLTKAWKAYLPLAEGQIIGTNGI